MGFRLVPISITLNDLELVRTTLFTFHCNSVRLTYCINGYLN